MRPPRRVLALAALLLAPPAALAHQGNPNFLSAGRPDHAGDQGLTVDVLNRDDRLLLHNTSGEDVVIQGYDERALRARARRRHRRRSTRTPRPTTSTTTASRTSTCPTGAGRRGAPQWKELVAHRALRVARPPLALDGAGDAAAGRGRGRADPDLRLASADRRSAARSAGSPARCTGRRCRAAARRSGAIFGRRDRRSCSASRLRDRAPPAAPARRAAAARRPGDPARARPARRSRRCWPRAPARAGPRDARGTTPERGASLDAAPRRRSCCASASRSRSPSARCACTTRAAGRSRQGDAVPPGRHGRAVAVRLRAGLARRRLHRHLPRGLGRLASGQRRLRLQRRRGRRGAGVQRRRPARRTSGRAGHLGRLRRRRALQYGAIALGRRRARRAAAGLAARRSRRSPAGRWRGVLPRPPSRRAGAALLLAAAAAGSPPRCSRSRCRPRPPQGTSFWVGARRRARGARRASGVWDPARFLASLWGARRPRVRRSRSRRPGAGAAGRRAAALAAPAARARTAARRSAGTPASRTPVAVLLPANVLHVLAARRLDRRARGARGRAPGRHARGSSRPTARARCRPRSGASPRSRSLSVALLLAGGIAQSLLELDAVDDLWDTPFGRAIVVKSALVVVLLALGALNRRRTLPRCSAPRTRAPRRAARARAAAHAARRGRARRRRPGRDRRARRLPAASAVSAGPYSAPPTSGPHAPS